jgi:hypothetical protein
MARKVGQIVGRGRRNWLVRVYNGRDPETKKRKYVNQTIRGGLLLMIFQSAATTRPKSIMREASASSAKLFHPIAHNPYRRWPPDTGSAGLG